MPRTALLPWEEPLVLEYLLEACSYTVPEEVTGKGAERGIAWTAPPGTDPLEALLAEAREWAAERAREGGAAPGSDNKSGGES